MNKFNYSIIVAIFCSLFLPSCKIFKHKPSKKKQQEIAAQKQKIDSMTAALKKEVVVDTNELLKALIAQTAPIWQKRIDLKTFSVKSKMHYEGAGKSYDFVANIRMRKDSLIWISVNVAGILQVARAIITPDSFKVILYTEKEAFVGPISKANDFLPAGLNFYSLQNLLLGNPILNNANTTSVSDVAPNWIVRFEHENYIEQLQFNKVDSTLMNTQLITQGVANKALTQSLSNFELFNNLKIATERKLNILNDSITLVVDMSYSNVAIDNELSYPFSIPQNYTIK
jgi:hypothetical protein